MRCGSFIWGMGRRGGEVIESLHMRRWEWEFMAFYGYWEDSISS